MHEGILYKTVNADNLIECAICLRRCRIGVGKLGACKARTNCDGKAFSLNYGQVAAAHLDPVEKKPLFHFYPASKVFSLGTWGCNYHCVHCQNWEIAYAQPKADGLAPQPPSVSFPGTTYLSPEQAVGAALSSRAQGICWTYNEPTVWLEYTLDCARLAKANGLYTAYVTNGYMTAEALDYIGPYLDSFRVDFKGFSPALYQRLAKVKDWTGMLDTTLRAKTKWNMHVEVVTNIIPTLNDDWQLGAIADWIKSNLGADTPWHVTGFHPDANLLEIQATPRSTIVAARQLGLDRGLRFVYTGNLPGGDGEDTRCPSCHAVAIRRVGFATRVSGVARGGCCSQCGHDLNLRGI